MQFLSGKNLGLEFGGVRQWAAFSVGRHVGVWISRGGVGPSASTRIGLGGFHWGLVLEWVWRALDCCVSGFSDDWVLEAEF